ncbi:MAG: hypothetical protein WA970_13820 [Gammaproteobacteria bacterium]
MKVAAPQIQAPLQNSIARPEESEACVPLTQEEGAKEKPSGMDRRPKFAERREARRLRQLRCGDYVFEPWLLRAAVRNAIITKHVSSASFTAEAQRKDLLP